MVIRHSDVYAAPVSPAPCVVVKSGNECVRDPIDDVLVRHAAELLDVTADEVRWECANLEHLLRWLGRLGRSAQFGTEFELTAIDRTALHARYVELRERGEAAVIDGGLLARALKRHGLEPMSPEVRNVQERLAEVIDDAITLARDVRPLLSSLVTWRVRQLGHELDVVRRRVLEDLPSEQHVRAQAALAAHGAAIDGMRREGRLAVNVEDGELLSSALEALEATAVPLAAWSAMGRLAERASRLFDEPHGQLWNALEQSRSPVQPVDGPSEERAFRSEVAQLRIATQLAEAREQSLAAIEAAAATGGEQGEAAHCATELRRLWVELWATLRATSRDIVPMAARSKWLTELDDALKRAVTLAARLERQLAT